jgi:hypothetical protein
MKSTWRIINEEKGKPKHNCGIQSLMSDNKLIRNQKEIADTFNRYFITTADSILVNNNNNKHSTNTVNPITYLRDIFNSLFSKITWKYTNTHEIEKIIKSLKSKDSSGYDEITSRIIKASSAFIISPLTHICNAILRSGVFLDRLKYAIVKPCFKKGNMQEISNYRPISLLTSSSKVIERLIYERLITHIEANSILVHEQYGFRTHSSTEKAAFTLINNILTAMNNKALVGSICKRLLIVLIIK